MAKYQIYQVQIFYCIDCLERDHKLVYHEDSESHCPVCWADPERQDFALKDEEGYGIEDIDSDHPIALEMLYQSRMRLFKRAIASAPLSTIEDMIGKLTEIKLFYSDEHPEPNGFRSGLVLDKMKELNEVKNLLGVNFNPEDSVEISDEPIY